ncbi:MAG: malate:quinone oxidoreductase [Thermobacillus sp. ZCTH02-B1]|uniref:malate dehydrogenase (quinone) n=1 Tax=Thermobacillus sp. ZCTH02-B1 TaxID=1858795 RepID=UPI000B56C3AE|nr:malate dehydrogenase (quinone) [Thermobacillus sp. ZCTH02-B1]OUM97205.1 MAG: malate:quinone oxidoreductase [Thermobacillus sp. ZCTH02-B1]
MGDRRNRADVILIGAGIMSATLGTMLKELAPEWDILVLERRSRPGEESSNEWNNAGTGHASLCELNYTTEKADGSIDISKAIKVNEDFQLSRQFWAYLVRRGLIRDPQQFIMPVPHMSFVQGEKDVAFLKKRHEAMSKNPLFEGMEFSDDPDRLAEWIPLMMEGRTIDRPIAATRIESGTDVNFGALTRLLFDHLKERGAEILYHRQVEDMKRKGGAWELKVRHTESGAVERYEAPFVFIGAGGGSLLLLQKSGIAEGRGIGGFPVSGLFMVCRNPELAERHYAKVYGKAAIGAPPMSVPHLDTRFIDGKPSLLFGPFAGFTPKFLKYGSNLDLLKSVKPHNLVTLIAAGFKNMSLTAYLIRQLMLTKEQRVEELRQFVPTARGEDWDLIVAGQRVQIIKDTEAGGRGTLQFGTEVISAADGSVAALLGASPGASTSVAIMLEVIRRCFPNRLDGWREKIAEMVPSWGIKLSGNPDLVRELHEETTKTLGLDRVVHPAARKQAAAATS